MAFSGTGEIRMDAYSATLPERLAALREKSGGRVDLDAIEDIAQSIVETYEGQGAPADLGFTRRIDEFLDIYHRAEESLAPLLSSEFRRVRLSEAIDHLGEVIRESEAATQKILESVEEIESHAARGRGARADGLRRNATEILEAANFQDITGQRISKVLKTIQMLAECLDDTAATFDKYGLGFPSQEVSQETETSDIPDQALLHGPQLAQDALSQDDIDALFDSLD